MTVTDTHDPVQAAEITAIERVVAVLEHVLFIRPDVAAVKVRQQPVALDGTPLTDQKEGSPLYVMAKEDGDWRLIVGQNTHVTDG